MGKSKIDKLITAEKMYASLQRRIYLDPEWAQRKVRKSYWKIEKIQRVGPEYAVILCSHRDAPKEYAIFGQLLWERAIPSDSFTYGPRRAESVFRSYVEKAKEEGLSG